MERADHEITASFYEMTEWAAEIAERHLSAAVAAIDGQFGKGFAKDNPHLVGSFMQAAALNYHAAVVKVSAQGLDDRLGHAALALEQIASAILDSE